MRTDVRRAILVPLDGSALAERALGPARLLARATGATLLLIRVAPNWVGPYSQLDHEVESAHRYLAAVAARERGHDRAGGSVTVLTQACAGDPAARIVGEAELWRTDRVVMSTHGRGGLGRLVHGSVAGAVLRASRAPVLLVPARAGVDPALTGDAVLAPVDGSAFAEVMLGGAAELARELGTPLVILQALQREPAPAASLAPPSAPTAGMTAEGHSYVEGLAAQVRRTGVEARGEVAAGAPATVILDAAERCNAAAIVMATHGRSGLSRLAFGSIAGEVLERTSWPLLLARPAAAPVGAVEPSLPAADGPLPRHPVATGAAE